MTRDHTPKPVPAVQNAVLILRLLAGAGRPLGATQIARETGLNVSSAFNILQTLSHEGLLHVNAETKTYSIGMGMMAFAVPLLGANPSDLLRPVLSAIAEENRVVVALWHITAEERMVLIDSFAAPNIVQVVIARNRRLPVFAGALGRAYAARLRLDEAAARKGYESVRWQNPPGFEAYWNDVLAAQQTGYARDRGQLFIGLDSVAAVACDANGVPRLGMSSITIAGQHDVEPLSKVAKALAAAARQVECCVFGQTSES